MFVRHRKTKKLYKALGTHYDGNRGLLYKLIEQDDKEDKRYFYDKLYDYFKIEDRGKA